MSYPNVKIILLFTSCIHFFCLNDCRSENACINKSLLRIKQSIIKQNKTENADVFVEEILNPLREVHNRHSQVKDFEARLSHFNNGFEVFWGEQEKTHWDANDYRILSKRMCWFLEDLMQREYLSTSDKEKVKTQHSAILDYVLNSLLGEFPFLTQQTIRYERQQFINKTVKKIDISFEPLYGRKLSLQKVKQVKLKWDRQYNLRRRAFYIFQSTPQETKNNINNVAFHNDKHSNFIHFCLRKLTQILWDVCTQPPDDLIQALMKEAIPNEFCVTDEEYAFRRKLANPLSNNPLEQVEQWSIFFSVLLNDLNHDEEL